MTDPFLNPITYDMSWSIQIFGKVLYGAAYDPLGLNLKLIYTNGSFVIVTGQGPQVTNAILGAPNSEAYALSLIR